MRLRPIPDREASTCEAVSRAHTRMAERFRMTLLADEVGEAAAVVG